MNNLSITPVWTLKRKGLVWAPDSQTFLLVTLLISHAIESKEGIMSIRVPLRTSNPARSSQDLTLVLSPESVQSCSWIPKSHDGICPSRLLPMVPRPGADVSSVSTLHLVLNSSAAIFAPVDLEPLSPHMSDISDFHALERISQAKTLYLHFGKGQFTKDDTNPLNIFLRAVQTRGLKTLSLNHKRQGLTEGNLHILRQALFPPPYIETTVSEPEEPEGLPPYGAESGSEQVVGKGRSAPLAILPDDEKRGSQLFLSSPSPDSPTEVNTPSDDLSTLSPSPPPIRPTNFERVSAPVRAEVDTLASLGSRLRGVPDDTIRSLLTRSGHKHLLKPVIGGDLSHASRKASFAKSEMNECRSIEDYIDAIVRRCLKSHSGDIADENSILLYDVLSEQEQQFLNLIDDSKYELRDTTDDLISELKEKLEESMDQLEARSQQCLESIQRPRIASKGRKAAKLKFNLLRRRQLYGFGLASKRYRRRQLSHKLCPHG